MKWFKHITTGFDQPGMLAFVSKCGMEGYGLYFRLIEIIFEKVNKDTEEFSLTLPVKRWCQLCGGIYTSKFKKIIHEMEVNLDQNLKFTSTSLQLSENLLKIQICNTADLLENNVKMRIKRLSGDNPRIDKNNKESNILTNITKESSQTELEKTSLRPSRTCVSETSSDETPEKSLEAVTTSQASETPALLTGKKEGLANEERKSGKPKDEVPYTDIVELYHQALPDLPKVLKLSEKRKSFVKQRWDGIIPERLKATGHEPTRENKLLYLKRYFEKVSNSTFLTGRSNAGFKADFEWLIRPENFVKVIEGRYS